MIRYEGDRVYDMKTGIIVGKIRYGHRWQFEPCNTTAFDAEELQSLANNLKARQEKEEA